MKHIKTKNKLNVNVSSFFLAVDRTKTLRDEILLKTLFETGCSLSELAKIKVKDIKTPINHITPPTITFNSRISVISKALADNILKYINERNRRNEEYIFSQQPTKQFSVKRIEQIIQTTLLNENTNSDSTKNKYLKINPQEIRYLHIAHALSKNLSLDTISAQTGLSKQRLLQIIDRFNFINIQSYSSFFEDKYTTKSYREGK
ncbi:MAG: site-specific integrase [Candidatus Woesearchaeota archaeon]|jgi:site-specific recombinase XerD